MTLYSSLVVEPTCAASRHGAIQSPDRVMTSSDMAAPASALQRTLTFMSARSTPPTTSASCQPLAIIELAAVVVVNERWVIRWLQRRSGACAGVLGGETRRGRVGWGH